MSNPLTIPQYYVFESDPQSDCNGRSIPSYVKLNASQKLIDTRKNTVRLGPYNLFQVSQYIQKQINGFLSELRRAGNCNKLKNNTDTTLDPLYSSIYTSSNCSDFKKETLSSVYLLQYSSGNRKHLCQIFADLYNLLTDFNNILLTLQNNGSLSKFTDNTENIKKIQEENVDLRKKLDFQLEQLYSEQHNSMKDTTLRLDSTIYATVLWTILASSVTYYVFMKL